MKSDELKHGRTIAIRLPSELATNLRKAAVLEANPDSVVARRLIASGLARERAEPPKPPEDAA